MNLVEPDDDKEEKIEEINPIVEEYLEIGKANKNDLDELYGAIGTNRFKLSTNKYTEYTINNQTFKILTSISYASSIKNKYDPLIWYTESIMPGNNKLVYQSWATPKYRKEWDTVLLDSKKIIINKKLEKDLYILNTETKAVAGGLISSRDFVALMRIFNHNDGTIQIASKSIKYNDIPLKKGFVRADVVLSGVLFESISQTELFNKYKIPALMLNDNTICEWTRFKYIVQTDIKGWIPSSIINAAMSTTNYGMTKDLTNYLLKKRLKFQ